MKATFAIIAILGSAYAQEEAQPAEPVPVEPVPVGNNTSNFSMGGQSFEWEGNQFEMLDGQSGRLVLEDGSVMEGAFGQGGNLTWTNVTAQGDGYRYQ